MFDIHQPWINVFDYLWFFKFRLLFFIVAWNSLNCLFCLSTYSLSCFSFSSSCLSSISISFLVFLLRLDEATSDLFNPLMMLFLLCLDVCFGLKLYKNIWVMRIHIKIPASHRLEIWLDNASWKLSVIVIILLTLIVLLTWLFPVLFLLPCSALAVGQNWQALLFWLFHFHKLSSSYQFVVLA